MLPFLHFRQPFLVSKLWLRDGSLVVPDIPSVDRPFHSLVLSDVGLLSACRRWNHANYGDSRGSGGGGGGGGSTLANRIACLEDGVDAMAWLNRTPAEWIHAQKRAATFPTKEEESTASLIIADPRVSRVVSPFASTAARDMPLVWLSSMNNPSPLRQKLNFKAFKKMIRTAFATFTSVNAERNYAEEILKAYEPMLRDAREDTSELRYTAIVNAILHDIRAVCGVTLYLTRLQRLSLSQSGSVYRVLSQQVEEAPVLDKDTHTPYDIPTFLNDRAVLTPSSEFLRKSLVSFTKSGEIEGMKRFKYPRSANDPALETTINILGQGGLTTAGSRVISHFATCKAWISEKGETEFAIKHGILN
ncbi:unnamed protein product [Mesocestoides corti]|uniref:Uncharacterized protein n=1 Tax=Mesocestoides corti TaxID=53468 RepID=A0A0R3UMU0_MESCO|nr:unnamed protein product [Mesocestoides corti]